MDPRPTPNWPNSSTSERCGQQESRLDLRLILPALAAWGGAAVGVAEPVWAGLVIGTGFLLTVLAARRAAWTLAATAAALMGAGLVGWGWAAGLAGTTPANWASDGAVIEAQAIVTSDARDWPASENRPAAAVLAVRLVEVSSRGDRWQGALPAQLMANGAAASLLDQPVGARIHFVGLARAPDPGQRSVANISLRSEVRVIAEPGPGARLANRFRGGLRAAMAHSPPQQAGLVPSLVVGDISELPAEVSDAFRTTGLTHLTAVSGTNLTLMMVFCLSLAKRLGLRGWWLRALGPVVAICFVVVCRAEPSVLRAAAMGLIAMAATGLARDRARGLRALSLAVLVLVLIDPWLARSWGFALSASATAGILWWGGSWQDALRRWMPGWLAESLAIPLAAQLATQPLVTALSGQISMVGLAANVTAGPFVGPVTILGLAAALVWMISPTLAGVVGWLAGWCVQPILLVAQIGASAPAATWRWPVSAASLILLGVGCLLAAQVVVGWILPRRWASLGVALLLVIGAYQQPPQPGWPGDWAVVACDVGQGGAQLIRAGPRTAILVDTGPDPAALRDCLAAAGVAAIELLVITHPHADHIGGLPAIAGRVPIGLVLTAGSPAVAGGPAPGWADGLPAPVPTIPGDVIEVGQARWTTLAAGPLPGTLATAGPDNASENDAGVVGLIEVAGLRVLVTGDLEVAGQQALIRAHPGLRADVLIVPHHGSPRQDELFIRAVAAPIALIQVGEKNDYGHPAASVLRLLAESGATVFRTDHQGALAVSADGRRVVSQR